MTRLLIDTDPGIDDALALLYAWGSPRASVEVVTTVAGNVPVDRGTTNVFRLIALRRPARIPLVASGAAAPLARPLTTAERHHGGDGLGDLDDWPPVEGRAGESAADVIVATAQRLGPRLTLVALGPLTNLALAVDGDPPALSRVNRVVAMGGAVDVPGNVTPDVEFNMHVDPEAAARVFDAGLPLDLVPLDATRQTRLSRRDLEERLGDRPALLATRILAFTRRAFRVEGGHMYLHDPLAIAVALDPTLGEWELTRLEVHSDGATRRVPGTPNCRVARHVDVARFLPLFLERLWPESS
jgi:purine nucleosidase/pyrimidine-specific ribonucleoside hydrolase